jgi:hypothetical protein
MAHVNSIDGNADVEFCPVGAPMPANDVPADHLGSIRRNADLFAAA